ncbi:MAG: methyltransferase domain-containing protein [Oscillibacter sp.]
MSSYDALSGAYDALMADASYCKRADYLERQFRKSAIPVRTVLDLACGTGTIACLLAERGYQVVATDGSEEMLTQAMVKAEALSAPPLFLHQSMPRLRLLEPVDAVVSTLDSLNYLTSVKDLRETFRRVYRWLKPGGQFLFDVNSAYKLRGMDGGLWIDEKPDTCCVWRTEFSQKTQICTYWVDLFRLRPDGAWNRDFEEHREKAWEEDALRTYLAEAGFAKVTVSGDLKCSPPKPDENRLIFRCEKR